MVELAMAAAKTLPAWTPAEAAPARTAVLGQTSRYGALRAAGAASITVPWDAVWWWTRPDGILQIQPASRSTTNPGLLVPDQIRTPLWAASSVFLDSRLPRTEEANGSEGWHPFISMVGAAWLLMAQPNITETRTTESTDVAPRRGDSSTGRSARRETSVVIIELRRDLAQSRRSPDPPSSRQYRGRWMVGWPNGYWRQQRYGPGGSSRKPVLIAPDTAGPKGAPLISPKERVYV
jgi:hypothetical protein